MYGLLSGPRDCAWGFLRLGAVREKEREEVREDEGKRTGLGSGVAVGFRK